MTGEERERKMLDDQIARAKAELESATKDDTPVNLEKREGEKISLSLFGNAPTPGTTTTDAPSTSGTTGAEAGPSKPTTTFSFGALPTTTTIGGTSLPKPAMNPLKRPAPVNVFKSAKPKTDSDAGSAAPIKQKQLSEVERLMMEDQARKMNRSAGRGGYQGHGPRRG